RIDLDDRAHDAELPVRTRIRKLLQQIGIEALVDDTEKAQARMIEPGQRRMFVQWISTACEMRGIDGAREAMHLRMLRTPRLVETWAAGEHHVRGPHQLPFARDELWRRERERAQFIHAIVD